MMWSFGRRDQATSSHQQHLLPTRHPKGSNGKGQAKDATKRAKNHKKLAKMHGGRSKKNSSLNIDEINVNETTSGIEVSFDFIGPESRQPQQANPRGDPVISIKEQIKQRRRVHRTQFSVSFPAIQDSSKDVKLDKWRPKDHRIQLLGASAVEAAHGDVLNLLQHIQVTDEYTAVNQELEAMRAEIAALEKDRNWLDTKLRNSSAISASFSPSKSSTGVDWDVGKMIDSTGISQEMRKALQRQRGNCFTVHFVNQRAKEVFLARCAAKQSELKNHKRRSLGDTITLGPHNCRAGGAGLSIRHLNLMTNNNGAHFGFFMSKDNGKSQTWGRIPPKLFRRIQEGGSHDIGDLTYLSTGPYGCYYAEFRSGECWWGNAVDDRDFHSVLQSWDVYRVVFGPIECVENDRGDKKLTNSWIILGRDGRAAWKNLPSRLHHRLDSRLASWAAPSEVSLGPGDSYFIRYLDGTVDYCLPAEVAKVCEYIERCGGSITDIALHPEISHGFVIRHTEMAG